MRGLNWTGSDIGLQRFTQCGVQTTKHCARLASTVEQSTRRSKRRESDASRTLFNNLSSLPMAPRPIPQGYMGKHSASGSIPHVGVTRMPAARSLTIYICMCIAQGLILQAMRRCKHSRDQESQGRNSKSWIEYSAVHAGWSGYNWTLCFGIRHTSWLRFRR